MALLEAISLRKQIKDKVIVHNVSLQVASGEVVGLLGPNGAGKTTTFYMISGLVEQTQGRVILDRMDISKSPLHQRAKLGIGYLPQESSIFKDLTVQENLLLAAEATIKDKETRYRRVNDLLEMFNIEPIRQHKGISLSGGERRRTEIARALVNSPKFLLLDEPFAGVDPIAVMDIREIIEKLTHIGIGVLITDHNVRETLLVCDRTYVIKSGELLATGTSEEIAQNEMVKQNYLGSDFVF